MQMFYAFSDPALENSFYKIESMRQFAGVNIDLIPNEMTILNSRHLLEEHNLGEKLFNRINQHLEKKCLSFKEGTIKDASIISAPTSTKHKTGQRDPEMHQTKKGNEWYFAMKMHIGVDDVFGPIHRLKTTSATVHDIIVSGQLLHGNEKRVSGDAGYLGLYKRSEHEHREVDWLINQRPCKHKAMSSDELKIETIKSSLRAQVEHSFARIKQQLGYNKVRYRGLKKNTNRLYLLAGFNNLLRVKSLLAWGQCAWILGFTQNPGQSSTALAAK